jgi:DNA-binding beta-propeller fold protein YncE
VAIDPLSGDVWVADSHNNRIQQINAEGAWIATYGGLAPGTGAGQFNLPLAIATDSSANVYVADSHNDRVVKRDAATGTWSVVSLHGATLSAPGAVAVDASGDLYVADSTRVLRVDSTATSEVEAPEGGFDDPGGLWLSGSHLYVSDSGHNRVLRQDLRSQEWTSFGGEGSGAGSFLAPLALAVGPDGGVLYVADQLNNRIERFSMSEPAPGAATTPTAPVLQVAQSPPPTVRRSRPRIRILGHRLRHGSLLLRLRCSEACRVTLSGRLRFGAHAKGVKLRRATRKLRAGVSSKLALKLGRRARRVARLQIARGRRPSARLSILAVGASGERSRRTIRFRL